MQGSRNFICSFFINQSGRLDSSDAASEPEPEAGSTPEDPGAESRFRPGNLQEYQNNLWKEEFSRTPALRQYFHFPRVKRCSWHPRRHSPRMLVVSNVGEMLRYFQGKRKPLAMFPVSTRRKNWNLFTDRKRTNQTRPVLLILE